MNTTNLLGTTVVSRGVTDALFSLLSTSLGINVKKDKEQTLNLSSFKGRTQTTPLVNSRIESPKQDEAESGLRDDTNAHISDSDLSWSPEAPLLQKHLHSSNMRDKIKDRDFLFSFFHNLRLVEMKITHTDESLSRFSALMELTISGNLITTLSHLPQSLHILHAYANQIIALPESLPPTIRHLGLGYNCISSMLPLPLSSSSGYHSLLSLDLSYNKIYSLNGLLTFLNTLPFLRHLTLVGNPICLLPNYTQAVLAALPWLVILDDTPVEKKGGVKKESSVSTNLRASHTSLSSNGTSHAQRSPQFESIIPNGPEVFCLAVLLEYLEGAQFSVFLQAETTISHQPPPDPTAASPLPPSPTPTEEELASTFYFIEFQMPGSKELHRSEPMNLMSKDSNRYDINFKFSITSELFADLPSVLESEIYFYILQCKLPVSILQTVAPPTPIPVGMALLPSKPDINSPKKAPANPKGAPAKKAAAKKKGPSTADSPSGRESVDVGPGVQHLSNDTKAHIQKTVCDFLKDNTANNPLIITPLGRAQMNLSSLLNENQSLVEEKCAVSFVSMVLQKQSNNGQIPQSSDTVLKVKATLNPPPVAS